MESDALQTEKSAQMSVHNEFHWCFAHAACKPRLCQLRNQPSCLPSAAHELFSSAQLPAPKNLSLALCQCGEALLCPRNTKTAGQRLRVARESSTQRGEQAPQCTLTAVHPSAAPCGAGTPALLRLRAQRLKRRRSGRWLGSAASPAETFPNPPCKQGRSSAGGASPGIGHCLEGAAALQTSAVPAYPLHHVTHRSGTASLHASVSRVG